MYNACCMDLTIMAIFDHFGSAKVFCPWCFNHNGYLVDVHNILQGWRHQIFPVLPQVNYHMCWYLQQSFMCCFSFEQSQNWPHMSSAHMISSLVIGNVVFSTRTSYDVLNRSRLSGIKVLHNCVLLLILSTVLSSTFATSALTWERNSPFSRA